MISKTYLSPIWGFFTCWLRNNPRHSFTFLQLTCQCLLVKIYLLRTGFFLHKYCFLHLDFFTMCLKNVQPFFHSKHGPHQSPSENPFLVHFTKLCAPCAPCVSKGGTCSQKSQLKTFASQTVHHIVRASCASVGENCSHSFYKRATCT